jgi:hypothetical protein
MLEKKLLEQDTACVHTGTAEKKFVGVKTLVRLILLPFLIKYFD